MSLFKNLFGSNDAEKSKEEKVEKSVPWKQLTNIDQLTTIKEKSHQKMQVIFKHSTRCGISRMVLRNFEAQFDTSTEQVDLYYLDLLNYRAISSEISAIFQVYHESPQLIIIKNGTTVYHASHSDIEAEVLSQYV